MPSVIENCIGENRVKIRILFRAGSGERLVSDAKE